MAVLVLAFAAGSFMDHGSAAAQALHCATDPLLDAVVDLRTPLPGDRVRGESTVAGTVRAPASLTKVELFVNDALVGSHNFDASHVRDFSFRWDPGREPAGVAYLTVVACGDLASGNATVDVRVEPRRPVWVGVVVGASGLVGLALSFWFWRAPGDKASAAPVGSDAER